MSSYYVQVGGREVAFRIGQQGEKTTVSAIEQVEGIAPVIVDLAPVHSNPQTGEGLYSLLIDNSSYQLFIKPGERLTVEVSRYRVELRVLTEREWRLEKIAPKEAELTGLTTVSAPMPGLVKGVLVQSGDEVRIGSRLLVLEAMKMENDIVSPRDGRVAAVHVSAGMIVDGGKALVDVE